MIRIMSNFWKKVIRAVIEIILDLLSKNGNNG